ncbi:MAG: isopenicillin N synthase family oxygenase [Proteobacteria bacterium]|nr:isopenicillin N synthase family oxygenase [Pseudomonadota bacterium]
MIPQIDIASLFCAASAARDAADAAIMAAAAGAGFMSVTGLPETVPIDRDRRQDLLRIFSLPVAESRKLWRQKFDRTRPNVYRGWFPVQDAAVSYKDGIDIGPDIAYGPAVVDGSDPLREATPLPDERLLPGWRAAAAEYYRGLEQTGQVLMRAIARGLGLDQHAFDDAFTGGVSTLRLIHYPLRSERSLAGIAEAELWVTDKGKRRHLVGGAHVDSGLMTLLAQDGVEGLQARAADGTWTDVPATEGTLAVNFGKLLDRWTGGRIKATEHRVIGTGRARCSIPFFYEPRVDAEIMPLPLPGIESFTPFLYGDYLWATATKFVEFRGLDALRKPRGAKVDAA